MVIELVERVYTTLQNQNLCLSDDAFSKTWLGQDAGYYESFVKNGEISVEAEACLAARLKRIGSQCMDDEPDVFWLKGCRLVDLHKECVDDLIARADREAMSPGPDVQFNIVQRMDDG